MTTRKGLGQANTFRTNNNTSTGYGVAYADEVSGHRTVANLTALYALHDWQLSASGDNTNSDAVGQLWYVVNADSNGNGCYYQLKDWNKRNNAAGWSIADYTTKAELQDKIDNIATADEEDITTEGDTPQTQVLKLKDRAYDSLNASGKGYKILRKNWQTINGERKNVLTQEMINEPNTIYEIRYDFDLNGQDITIHNNSRLNFVGGVLKNGKITGNNTIITSNGIETIFESVTLLGSFNMDYSEPEMFGIIDGVNDVTAIQNACTASKNIHCKGNYIIDSPIYIQHDNTHIKFYGDIQIPSRDKNSFLFAFIVNNKEKFTLEGGKFHSTRDKEGTAPANHTRENNLSSNCALLIKKDTVPNKAGIKIINVYTEYLEASQIRNTADIYIGDCQFNNCLIGLFCDCSKNILIERCKVSLADKLGSGDHCLYFANVEDLRISYCSFYGDSFAKGLIDISYYTDRTDIYPNKIYIDNCILEGNTCFNNSSHDTIVDNCTLISSSKLAWTPLSYSRNDKMEYRNCSIKCTKIVETIPENEDSYISLKFSNCKIDYNDLCILNFSHAKIQIEFSNCTLTHGGINKASWYMRSPSWNLSFTNCDIIGNNSQYFIQYKSTGSVFFSNCNIKNMNIFIDYEAPTNSTMEAVNCIIDSKTLLYKTSNSGSFISKYKNCINNLGQTINGIGSTEMRPSSDIINVGKMYYDTTLKKYIVWNGTEWTNMDGSSLMEQPTQNESR